MRGLLIINLMLGIFQVTDPHHPTEAKFLLQDQLNPTEPDSFRYQDLQGLMFSPINVKVLAAYLKNSNYKWSAGFLLEEKGICWRIQTQLH